MSPGPRFHSRFGGLWTDRLDADDVLEGRLRTGEVTERQGDLLRRFIRDGALELPGAVPPPLIDAVAREFRDAFAGGNPDIWVEHVIDDVRHFAPARPELEQLPGKMLDLHGYSATTRDAVFAPEVRELLTLLFEGPILAFQSLGFVRGTEQPAHRDSAYVVVSAPMEMVASWMALEDVGPGSGELEYFAGSHRIGERLLVEGRKDVPAEIPDHGEYLESLRAAAVAAGCERRGFLAKKGDILLWSADLLHGGSRVEDPTLSRRSLVTHYCPASRQPGYFAYAPHSEPVLHREGCYYCHSIRSAVAAPAESVEPQPAEIPAPQAPGLLRRGLAALARAVRSS